MLDNNMKNINKTTKTILFASLIAVMILPFGGMDYAVAEVEANIEEPQPETGHENSDVDSLVDALVDMKLREQGFSTKEDKQQRDMPPRFLPDDPRHPDNLVNGKINWDKTTIPEGGTNSDAFQQLTFSHTHYGTLINKDVSDNSGIYSRNEVHTTIDLADGEYLYAPTNMGPNKSPLEIVTFYEGVGQGLTSKKVIVYDHDQGSWKSSTAITINNSFLDDYTLTIGGNNYYYAEVYKSGSTWYAKIYNFDTSSWETMYTSTGDSSFDDGWGFWEEYYLVDNCPTLPEIREGLMKVLNSGTWKYVTSTYGSIYNTNPSCTYSGTHNSNYYDWEVDD